MAGTDAQVKDSAGRVIGTVGTPGITVTEPMTYTLEQQWLTLTTFDGRQFRSARGGKPLWIGETKASQTNLDLRTALDYLVIPTVAAFGQNLPQTHAELHPEDPAVRVARGLM